MYDPWITLVGNATVDPEQRVTANTASVVTTFRLATTSRRYDRESGRWVDGHTLFVKVNCWRMLAQHVVDSVNRGMPLIVVGRLYTREYEVDVTVGEGADARTFPQKRSSYELDAVAVGPDLSRGTAVFTRYRPPVTHEVNDGVEHGGVAGEPTLPVEEAGDPFEAVGELASVGS